MTTTRQFSLKKKLYNYRHTIITALVFTIELTVWAAFNLKGSGDKGWDWWRSYLLLSMFLVALSGLTFNKDDEWYFMFSSLIPWLGMLIVASVYCFIQMNLNFLTLDLFYIGVLGSVIVQGITIAALRNAR